VKIAVATRDAHDRITTITVNWLELAGAIVAWRKAPLDTASPEVPR